CAAASSTTSSSPIPTRCAPSSRCISPISRAASSARRSRCSTTCGRCRASRRSPPPPSCSTGSSCCSTRTSAPRPCARAIRGSSSRRCTGRCSRTSRTCTCSSGWPSSHADRGLRARRRLLCTRRIGVRSSAGVAADAGFWPRRHRQIGCGMRCCNSCAGALTMPTCRLTRREVTALLGCAAVWPHAAFGQQGGSLPRIGFMGNSTEALEANLVGPFREELHALGYREGHNIVLEYRWAEGKYERFPALVAELLAAKVDVIVTAGTPAAMAVKQATTSVPVVMVAVGDPVNTGLVPSLARPGGNLTGLSSIAPDLEGKRLQLLREV